MAPSRPQSEPAHRPFPLGRTILTIATGAALVVLLYYVDSIHLDNIPRPGLTPFGTMARYSIEAMSVVGLLNGAILFSSWRPIRGAAARGLLLATTGAISGAVGGSWIGSMEWAGEATISRAVGAVFVGFLNMVVWGVGGAVGREPGRKSGQAE